MDLSKVPRRILLETLTKLTTFFTKKVSLRHYEAELVREELIDRSCVPKNLSDHQWTLYVLEMIPKRGHDAILFFFQIFQREEWITSEIEKTINYVKLNQKEAMDFRKVPQGVLQEALTRLTTYFTKKIPLRDYEAELLSAGLIDRSNFPENISDQKWALSILKTILEKGSNDIIIFLGIFKEDKKWITTEIEKTINEVEIEKTINEVEIKEEDELAARLGTLDIVNKSFQKQEKTTVIGGLKEEENREAIKNLDTFKEHNIKAEAKRLGIEIDIDKGRGKITLKGHESDVTEVFMSVKEILLTVSKKDEFCPVEQQQRFPKFLCSTIERLMQQYILDDAKCKKLSEVLLKEMEDGLSRERNAKAAIKMFPTYVRALPDGSEFGKFLALDLGGRKFRVSLITLKGSEVQMEDKVFPIAEDMMLGPGTELFDLIAKCIAEFMALHNLKDQKLPLGFTFSFPLKQEGLNVGRLVTCRCGGVVGNDVVRLLHEAVERGGDISVDCVAILNDTVACLMFCAFYDHNCEVGVILGTGFNACYMEKIERVGTWDGDSGEPRQVIINTEWGAFGDNGAIDFVRTNVDKEVDSESINPGKQLYEKMISAMYIGEITRRCIVHAIKDGLILDGELTELMDQPQRFYTKYVSEIGKDDEFDNFQNTRMVLDELGYDDVTIEDCYNVRYISHIVGQRAAFLASSGIATLINRINKPQITVAVGGSLYRYHPEFHDFMMEKISSLLNPGLRFKLMLSDDGSGKGAAVVAAVSATS